MRGGGRKEAPMQAHASSWGGEVGATPGEGGNLNLHVEGLQLGVEGSGPCPRSGSHRAERQGGSRQPPGQPQGRSQDTPQKHPWCTAGLEGALAGKARAGRGRLPNRVGGSLQQTEMLRVTCRKGGIIFELCPLRRYCSPSPRTCEWSLFGNRVFASEDEDIRVGPKPVQPSPY